MARETASVFRMRLELSVEEPGLFGCGHALFQQFVAAEQHDPVQLFTVRFVQEPRDFPQCLVLCSH